MMQHDFGTGSGASNGAIQYISWATAGGVMSLPAWIGYVKDISAFAAVLAPISGFILTLLLMRETMARTRVHESRLPKDDEMPDE